MPENTAFQLLAPTPRAPIPGEIDILFRLTAMLGKTQGAEEQSILQEAIRTIIVLRTLSDSAREDMIGAAVDVVTKAVRDGQCKSEVRDAVAALYKTLGSWDDEA